MQMLPLVRPVGAVSGGVLDWGSEGGKKSTNPHSHKRKHGSMPQIFPKARKTTGKKNPPITGKGI